MLSSNFVSILNDVQQILNYGTKKELNASIKEANAERRNSAICAIQEDDVPRTSNQRLTAKGEVNPDAQEEPEIQVGEICGLKIASGEVIAVKLTRLDDNTAGIIVKGWNKYKVPASAIVPYSSPKPTLPDWFKEGTTLEDGKTITSIDRSFCTLSDGNRYQHIIVLLYCKPSAHSIAA